MRVTVVPTRGVIEFTGLFGAENLSQRTIIRAVGRETYSQ
jgi:hypothetical protein